MINDYATLVQSAKDYLKTPTLDSYIDLYIQQTEADINREIRHPYMEAEQVSTLTSDELALPTDFLELRDISTDFPQGTFSLEQVTIEALHRFSDSHPNQRPIKYAIANNNFVFASSFDGAEVKVLYYQKVPALSDSQTTNWVIDNYPMLYWYGVIKYAWAWKMEDTNIAFYEAKYADEERRVKKEGRKRRYGGQGMMIRGI